MKIKGLRQATYSKAYLKEMLDVLGLINKSYLKNDIEDLIGASISHQLKREFEG
jgi:hypothetical protein